MTLSSSGDAYEPLDLSTSRFPEPVIEAEDSLQLDSTGLPSPSGSEPDSKPILAAAKVPPESASAVPCRRSCRQRRRTAKAAGEDGCTPLEEVALVPVRRPRAGGRPAYICQLCDKEFTKHSSLVRHTYQHSGESDTLHASVLSFTRLSSRRPSVPLGQVTR